MLRTSRKMAQRLLSMLCSVSLLGTFLPAAGAVDEPSGRAGDFSLNYAPIGEDGTSGKLWIGNIGETVFDDITYNTPTGGGLQPMENWIPRLALSLRTKATP